MQQPPGGGPYGGPPTPYPGQGYGPPGPPQPPHGVRPPVPPARRSGGKIAGVVIALVMVLVAGGALYVLNDGSSGGSGDDDKAPGNALGVDWKIPFTMTTGVPNGTSGLPGTWVKGNTLIYGDEHGVRGYDLGTGKQTWQLKPPKGAGEPCAMSWNASPGGVGAVMFDAGGDDCAILSSVEVDTGAVTWALNLSSEYPVRSPMVQVNDRNITVQLGSGGDIQVFDARRPREVDPLKGLDCGISYTFGADYLVGNSKCGNEMLVFNTRDSGEDPVKVPGEKAEVQWVASSDPLAVVLEDDRGQVYARLFDEDGTPKPRVQLVGEAGRFGRGDRLTTVVGDSILVGAHDSGVVAATDLSTGRLLWKAPQFASYLGYDDSTSRVLLTVPAKEGVHQEVHAFDARSGKSTVLGALVAPDGTELMGAGAVYSYVSGRIVMVGNSPEGQRLAIAFRMNL